MMKKRLLYPVFALILVAIFALLMFAFPKNASLLPLLLVLFAFDYYLWTSLKNRIFSFRPLNGYLLMGLYWLPLMLLASSIITGLVVPFTAWDITVRTYLVGFIMVTYVSKFFPAVFLLIADTVRLFHYAYASFQHGEDVSYGYFARNKFLKITGWSVGGLFFLTMFAGMVFWAYDFRVREVHISLPELPKSFDGLRIVQISDIHLGSWPETRKLEEAVKIVNDLHPDVIFFTGDMLNFSSPDINGFGPVLEKLSAPGGIYAILGNHDYGEYVRWPSQAAKMEDHMELIRFYDDLGWKLLRNEHSLYYRGKDSIAILGVENWGATHRFPRLGNVKKAQEGVENVAVQLLLSHDPTHWEYVVSKEFPDVDITFSGHTHGFQFGIDTDSLKWSPLQGLSKEWDGLYTSPVNGSHPQYLYVNCGLGTIGYPGRVGILPEITLFILSR
jgi:uncharacterized protein